MKPLIVSGISTDVGKTVASAILAKALQADFWKPVQCGCGESDRKTVARLTSDDNIDCHPEAYRLQAPCSPHHAAFLEGVKIVKKQFILPKTKKRLIIEGSGGLLVPFNSRLLLLDLFAEWPADWILVSKHYLGSINHTLLSLEAMKKRGVTPKGIVFNGNKNPSTEKIILKYAKPLFWMRIQQEKEINQTVINQYAQQWKPCLKTLLNNN
jgi:dethiobiotin synthetase